MKEWSSGPGFGVNYYSWIGSNQVVKADVAAFLAWN